MKIELSMEQLQTIGQVLETAPYKIAAPVLAHLQQQLDAARREEMLLDVARRDLQPTAPTANGNGKAARREEMLLDVARRDLQPTAPTANAPAET
jgi:hypothetical protein